MEYRRLAVFVLFVAVVFAASARAQDDRDPVPLKDWAVPFEQIRVKVMETQPRLITERSLHPSVNAVPSAASHFITTVPCRVVDTRLANGTYGGPKLVGGTSRSFAIPAGPCAGLPVAAAYSLNLTVTQPEADNGFLKAYPTGSAQPLVSSLNFNTNETKGNAAIVPANGSGSIDIFSNVTTHLIIDINGYFVEGVVTNLNAGTGMTGGGTGNVTLGLAPGGVTSTQLAGNSVSTGAIQDNAITGAKIASGQVVKSINSTGVDAVTLQGGGTATVNTSGRTITVTAAAGVSGSIILGVPGDTTLIGAGYNEIGPSGLVGIWQSTSTTGAPSARQSPTAVWTGTKMIVWGGYNVGAFESTGGQYDPTTNSWVPTSTTAAPSGRVYHTAVWTGTRMIVWGGQSPTYENTGGQYDPTANSWVPTSTTAAPAGRFNHTAVWTGTKMIVWGGENPGAFENTGGRYDPAAPAASAWATTSTIGPPSGRNQHTAVWTGTKMIVWGGFTGVSYENTGAQYDPVSDNWAATSTTGAPSVRDRHTAVWTGTKMIVWGGFSGSLENTGAQYDPTANSWAATTATGAPSGRYYHTAVWTGTKMIVWGGYTGVPENTGAQYDPTANSWLPTSTTGAPMGRYVHAAVWTGTKMIVWGGYSGVNENTGGWWSPLSFYIKN